MNKQLILALSKGRILDETLPLLADAGIVPAEDLSASRKLLFDTNLPDVKLVVIRATDVRPMYSSGPPMSVWPARMCCWSMAPKDSTSAGPGDRPLQADDGRCHGGRTATGRRRVATKFTEVARRYYAEQGIQPRSSSCTVPWNWRR